MVIVVSICALTSDAFFSYSSRLKTVGILFTNLRTQTNAQRERERKVKEVKEGVDIMCTVDKVRRTSAFIVFIVSSARERDLISQYKQIFVFLSPFCAFTDRCFLSFSLSLFAIIIVFIVTKNSY